MEIKLLNDTKTIEPSTTEPSKPYLAQKVVGGTEYYPCEISSGEGVAIKGNGVSYRVVEYPISLKLRGNASSLSQIKIYDANNILKGTYDNPANNVAMEVFAGGRIEWIHDAEEYWAYRPVGGSWSDVVYLTDGGSIAHCSSCYSNVPANASGEATMHRTFYEAGNHGTYFGFGENYTTGWIKSADCYPYL